MIPKYDKYSKRPVSIGALIIFLLIGVFLFSVGLAGVYKVNTLIDKGTKANGEIVGSRTEGDGKHKETILTISFNDTVGESEQFDYHMISYIPNIGDNVTVLYDPQSPHDAMVDEGMYSWVMQALMAFCGSMVIFSTIFAIKSKLFQGFSA